MHPLSLKTKMTCAVALLVVFLLAVMVFFADLICKKTIRDSIAREQFALVSMFADEIDGKMRLAQKELVAFASTIPTGDPAAMRTYLAAQKDSEPLFDEALALYSPTGVLLALYPEEPEMLGRDFSFRPYFQKTLRQRSAADLRPFHFRPEEVAIRS